jgi:hypothetical protein
VKHPLRKKTSKATAPAPRRWGSSAGRFLAIFLGLALFLNPPQTALGDCDGGPIAPSSATCQFTQAANASLGLNATIWFQQPVNDSWWWAEYGNLTWAFEPNLAFWSYVWADVARITAAFAPAVSLKEILWSLPLKDWENPNSTTPMGQLIDFNNGTYYHFGCFLIPYPSETRIVGAGIAVDNYTIIAHFAPLFPSESWFAKVYWDVRDKTDLSDAQWTALADQLAAHLNATWYIDACVFKKEYPHCDETNGLSWPCDAIFLGLLVLLGVGTKRKRRIRRNGSR